MDELIRDANSLFANKINILVVDDDQSQLFVHKEMLNGPLSNVRTCSSLQEAQQYIREASFAWHCWVLDIDLGSGKSGLELLDSRANFPFVIVLSGLRSMKIGSDALRRGAMSVFDKGSLDVNGLYGEICRIAALGYLLEGKGTQYLSTFSILKDFGITDIEAWANKACITIRQLQRICAMHSSLTPKNAIILYNSLFYLLIRGINLPDETERIQLLGNRSEEFYLSCIREVLIKDR